MNTVKIKTKVLLEKVKSNRDTHRELFLKAQIGYRKDVIDELDRRLPDAKAGKPIVRGMALPEPQDHTADYDRIVTMLEMTMEDVIEISSTEFDWFVMDNWSWKQMATFTNANYAAKA